MTAYSKTVQLDQALAAGDTVTITVNAPAIVPPVTPPPVTPPPTTYTDLPGWKLIYSDDFTSGFAKTRYGAYPSPWPDTRYKAGDHTNGGIYTGLDSITAANGTITVRLYRDGANQPRSVAFYPLLPGSSNNLLYGRYAIRFRASEIAPGWKTAWLLWPGSNTWPRDGEIDFPEGNLNATISAFVHHQGATSGGDQDAYKSTATYSSWHTTVVEWKPGSCEFFLDGTSMGHSTTRIPNTPMHWVIQSETALDGSTPGSEAKIEIDSLAVWTYAA